MIDHAKVWHSRALLLLISLLVWDACPLAFAGSFPLAENSKWAGSFSSLPASFEANVGQSDPTVRFLSRGAGYSILFRDEQADIILARKKQYSASPSANGQRQSLDGHLHSNADAIGVRIVGASPNVKLSGRTRLPGTVNYFSGADPAQWHTGIPTFASLEYRGVYPGVDLLYYSNRDKLEFDFRIASGSSASGIRLHFDGAKGIGLDAKGNLDVVAAHGRMSLHKPLIYQLGSDNKKHLVEGSFHLLAGGNLEFTLGSYDHSRELVIDPILDYSTYLGSASAAEGIAVDSAGEALVAGYTLAGMPTTPGSYQANFPAGGKTNLYPAGKALGYGTAAFVAKFNSSGTALIYCTYLSGSQNDAANSIAVDAAGNAYVAGQTQSNDFPVTAGAFQTKNPTKVGAGFITELNSAGTALIYSTYLSGSVETSINSLAVDDAEDAFVTGFTFDSDFPVTSGAFQTASPVNPIVGGKGFVSKLAAGGQRLLYSTYLGGSKEDQPSAIAVDETGNAYITGGTQSPDFPTSPGAFQLVNKATIPDSIGTGFITKLNPSGTALVYSTFLGGSKTDSASAIAVDSAGSAFVTGYAASPDFPTTAGVFQPKISVNSSGFQGQDAFVTRLNPAGSGLVYSTFLSGTYQTLSGAAFDNAFGIAVDSSGNAYVVGSTADLDFPVTPGALQTNNIAMLVSGDLGSFLTKLNPTASEITYATYLTGSGNQNGGYEFAPAGPVCDCANGVVLDQAGNAYVAGATTSTDFPTTLNAYQNQSGFSVEPLAAFVTKFDATETQALPLTTTTVTANQNPQMAEQPVTFTATVQSSSGSVPTGTVGFTYQGLFYDGEPYAFGPWGDVALDASGTATFTMSSLASGPISVVAYYLGDPSHAASRGSVIENVGPIPTTTTVTANMSTAPYGTPILFSTTVVETASGKPARGTVLFGVGTLVYEEVALDANGRATWTNGTGGPPLPVGMGGISVKFLPGQAAPEAPSQGSIAIDITSLGVAAAPTISPAAGTYAATQSVSLSDTTPGAVIYYTTNGSAPVAGVSPLASLPIQVAATETVEALAVAPGYTESPIASAAYVIQLPPPDFTVTAVPGTLSISGGQSATSIVAITASDGFTQNVSLSCSGLPAGATCTFSPASVAGGSGSTTLTVAAASTRSTRPSRLFLISTTALALLFGWIPSRRTRLRGVRWLVALAAVTLCSLGGCGGSSSGNSGTTGSSQTTVTSVLTVNATSGALTHAVTLTLTVTQP